MTDRVRLVAALALVAFSLSSAAMAQSAQLDSRPVDPISESEIAYPYRLFATTNIWTFVLLDTATGRAWQVNYSLDKAPASRLIINESSLLPKGTTPKNGRFTLNPTENMYTFLLLDREDSRIWQLQWSLKPETRGIIRRIPEAK